MATAQLDMLTEMRLWLDIGQWLVWVAYGWRYANRTPTSDDVRLAVAMNDIAGRAGMMRYDTCEVWFTDLLPTDKQAIKDDLWAYVVPPETVARCAPFVYAE